MITYSKIISLIHTENLIRNVFFIELVRVISTDGHKKDIYILYILYFNPGGYAKLQILVIGYLREELLKEKGKRIERDGGGGERIRKGMSS